MIVVSLLLCAAAVGFGIYEKYRNKKMYQVIDTMLDQVLNREKISASDIQEGEISALAGKAKRIQEKLEGDLIRAEEEKEQVKALISNMSHQLKTPLAGLMMYRELLEDEKLAPEQRRKFLEKMKQQAEKIDWILRALFKMVKLEQGAIVFETGEYSLKDTLSEAVNSIYKKAEEKEISISMEPFTDCMVAQNPKWTAEVFENLLENAVKYTSRGGRIVLRIKRLELYTQIEVEDNGMGIRAEELTEIFKRFYRSKEVENMEGSGIGLYLSRLILEKEKGYLTVSSVVGEGSVFSVFLQNCHN